MRLLAERLPILAYHSIADGEPNPLTIRPDVFQEQMRFLKDNGYRVDPLEEAVSKLATGQDVRRSVVLTFDDGYRDFLENAAPLLARYDFRATVFVITNCTLPAGDVAEAAASGRRYLRLPEIREVLAMGHAVGSHSVSHPWLSLVSPAELRSELETSKAFLEAELGVAVPTFAYPYGEASRRERRAVRDAGYEWACIVGGLWANDSSRDRFALGRFEVRRHQSLRDFQAILESPFKPALVRAALSRRLNRLRRGVRRMTARIQRAETGAAIDVS